MAGKRPSRSGQLEKHPGPVEPVLTNAGGTARSVLRKALGSLLRWGRGPAPAAAPSVRPGRDDALRTYPTVGLTPSKLLGLLRSADAGQPAQQFALFDQMREKWPRLAAVDATRRLALTGLAWEVAPPAQVAEQPLAQAAAAHCATSLAVLERLPEVLEHLALAIGYGIAVAELVWEDGQLADIVPVPFTRLVADPQEPWRLRVQTEEAPTWGVALDEQPHKWIVHQPRGRAGRLFEGGLLRASAPLYLAQNLSFKDWLIFSQVAGMPVRVAQFEPGLPEDDRQKLLDMLTTLGTDAVAVFGKNVDLRFIDAPRGSDRPYEPIQDYCNVEVTILWLGQHLTTDIKNSGSRAAAEVHDRVREDLLVADIADEGHTLRRDLLRPLVLARFGADAPVPRWQRSVVQELDSRVLAETLAVAVNELGLRVPAQWAHEALGVPQPRAGEAVLAAGGAA